MVDMATDQDQPAAAESPRESVVEFGAEPPGARRIRPRWSTTGFAVAVGSDRRAVPLAAMVAAVALFGSLVSEWQVTAVNTGDAAPGLHSVATYVADLGAWGGAYLVGLFILAATTVVAMFGPAAGARYAYLVGLSTGGVLLAMLTALVSTLGTTSRINAVFFLPDGADQFRPSYGRGVWCALFGVAVAMLALYLTGRHTPPAAAPEPNAAGDDHAAPLPPAWSWRRPRVAGGDDEGPPAAPFNLTVTSTTPFPPSAGDRDKPAEGPGGISG
jgi:hypothetical protein